MFILPCFFFLFRPTKIATAIANTAKKPPIDAIIGTITFFFLLLLHGSERHKSGFSTRLRRKEWNIVK